MHVVPPVGGHPARRPRRRAGRRGGAPAAPGPARCRRRPRRRSGRTRPRRARSCGSGRGPDPVACAVACWDGEVSQQPMWPQEAQRRRCTHQPPAARHSAHPVPLGGTVGSRSSGSVICSSCGSRDGSGAEATAPPPPAQRPGRGAGGETGGAPSAGCGRVSASRLPRPASRAPTAAAASPPTSSAACCRAVPRLGRPARAPGAGRRLGQPHLPAGRRAAGPAAQRRRLRGGRGQGGPLAAPAGAPAPAGRARARGHRRAGSRATLAVVGAPLDPRAAGAGRGAGRPGRLRARPGRASSPRCAPRRRGRPAARTALLPPRRAAGLLRRRRCTRPWRARGPASTSTPAGRSGPRARLVWERPAGAGSTATSRPGNLLLDDAGALAPSSTSAPAGSATRPATSSSRGPLLRGEARAAFRDGVDLDDDTWARARGWALWKALIVSAAGGPDAAGNRAVVDEVLADHARR